MLSAPCLRLTRARGTITAQRGLRTMFHRGVQIVFSKYLFLTNSLTSGGCMGIGDLIQQEIEYQSKKLKSRYDWQRTKRMFIVGTLMGPMHHYYYLYLDKILPKVDLKTVFSKVFCDQLFASPATIISFFVGMAWLEHKTIVETQAEIKDKFLYVYMGDCMFWPPIQFINFYYLAPKYRVFYINIATMAFNIFLSYMKHYDRH